MALYDSIGVGCAAFRRPDLRIASVIDAALGDALSVVNIGAGAGSYEPRDRRGLAVEPSEVMIRQRPDDAAPCLQRSAEALPVERAAVDAATWGVRMRLEGSSGSDPSEMIDATPGRLMAELRALTMARGWGPVLRMAMMVMPALRAKWPRDLVKLAKVLSSFWPPG